MRYCPNTACPHRTRNKIPAEYLDRIRVCADCGMDLVDDVALAQAGVAPAARTEERGYREHAAGPVQDDPEARAKAARVDIATGAVLIGLSVVVSIVTYLAAVSAGGGKWFVTFVPLFYGFYRLTRGLGQRR